MEKVFFKPYQHIIITPSFSKITFGFTLKTFLKAFGAMMGGCFLVGFLVGLTFMMIYGDYLDLSSNNCLLLALPIMIFVQSYIIHKTVKRNATIALKL